jgi:hypothetical protein
MRWPRPGGRGRVDHDHRGVTGRVVGLRLHAGYLRDRGEPTFDGGDRGPVAGSAGQFGGQDQRAVEPGAEPGGNQVVALADG